MLSSEGTALWRVIKLREHYDKQNLCPDCGRVTSGTLSEGGARWALCEGCYNRQFPAPDPPAGYGVCRETGCSAQEEIDGWE